MVKKEVKKMSKERSEKKEKYKLDSLKKENLKKKQNFQITIAVILMAGIILAIIIVPFIKRNFFDKFDYGKLEFQKTQLGKLYFYSTRIPLANRQGQIIGSFAINLRNNPKKLEYIGVNIPNNTITFKKTKDTYISLDPKMKKCDDNTIALVTLSSFLKGFGGINLSSAVSDKEYAKENKLEYKTCNDSVNNTIIYITSGDNTEIKKISDDCYELVYKNCEITQVTEKFIMIIVDKYMEYFVIK